MVVLGEKEVWILDLGFVTPKRYILMRNRVFWHILRQICAGVLAVGDWKNPQNEQNSRVNLRRGRSRILRKETPQPIWIKFCRITGIPDLIAFATFGDDRLRGSWAAGGQILPFLIEVDRCQLHFSLGQPHSGTSSSISDSPIPSPITSFSSDSPLCTSIG